MEKHKNNTLRAWRLKKTGIIGALVMVSAAGAGALHFGRTWLLIPVLLLVWGVWMLGNRTYVCPHCKTPIDLRQPLHMDMKCTQCGRSIVDA